MWLTYVITHLTLGYCEQSHKRNSYSLDFPAVTGRLCGKHELTCTAAFGYPSAEKVLLYYLVTPLLFPRPLQFLGMGDSHTT